MDRLLAVLILVTIIFVLPALFTGALNALNLRLWVWFVYQRPSGFTFSLIREEAFIPADVRKGDMPLGGVLILSIVIGLAMVGVNQWLKVPVVSSVGWKVAGVAFIIIALKFSVEMGVWPGTRPQEERASKEAADLRQGIQSLTAKIDAEGDRVSSLGLWRRYWRALCHEALIVERHVGGGGGLDPETGVAVKGDLDFVANHPLADAALRKHLTQARAQFDATLEVTDERATKRAAKRKARREASQNAKQQAKR